LRRCSVGKISTNLYGSEIRAIGGRWRSHKVHSGNFGVVGASISTSKPYVRKGGSNFLVQERRREGLEPA
jgi:hypothetical protein